MNNNTQIETVEEAGKRIYPIQIDDRLQDINELRRKSFHYGVEWKGQQDEARYKELLDRHNDLLEKLKKTAEFGGDEKMYKYAQELINKAKNIKL